MMPADKKRCVVYTAIMITLMITPFAISGAESGAPDVPPPSDQGPSTRTLRAIHIMGNKTIPDEAILNYIPYYLGESVAIQPGGTIERTGSMIRNLYENLKRFRAITVKADAIEPDEIDLYIILEEKKPLKDVIFTGNKHLTETEIRKKVNLDIPAVEAEELKLIAQQIKRLYYEKGYQNVIIDTKLTLDEDDKAIAEFLVTEGEKSRIRRIRFEGNEHISEKDLKNVLFTKEEWILSFLDKTGSFHPDRLEADKHMVEQHYQNNGYLHAKVVDVRIEVEPDTNILTLIFIIEEGDQYRFGMVEAPGNDIVSQEFLLANIPIRSGNLYSRDVIANTIKMLEFLWGNMGYIFASVDPSVTVDEEEKLVNISLISDIGKKITLNRLTIKGNKKTRDKVIRRRIPLQEGGILTQGAMDSSKNNVGSLGYFDQKDGVNWKVNRLNDEEADLDLVIKEAKTGHANFQLGFGGADSSIKSPLSSINVKGTVADTNLFGSGTSLNIEGSWSKEEQTLVFHLAQPWLFDKPVSGAMDIYHKRPSYDQLRHVMGAVHSKITGGALTLGFITNPRWSFFNNAQALFSLGIDSVSYNAPPRPLSFSQSELPICVTPQQANIEYATILAKEFTPGDFVWLANQYEQDKRNHPIHTSRGHKWKVSGKIAIPTFDRHASGIAGQPERFKIGFGKLFMDYTWYTPIINEQDLVFKLHLFFGLSTPLKGKTIPFGELYHIGGDTTVRGFTYGEIGPKFEGDTIGGKKAFYLNAELVFPITQDFSMKGVAFYDGGASWDNPYATPFAINTGLVTDNNFDYRHAVGFGLRMLRPMPVRIDWGFKLDPRTGEKESQVHFGMTYDW
jgi:outer membrane protein insertion porin family